MKSISKILGLSAALLLGSFSTVALAAPEGMEQRLMTMKSNLGLTDEQVEKIRPVIEHNIEAMKAAAQLEPEEKKAAVKEARMEMMAAMQEILTPEQVEKLRSTMSKGGGKKAGGE